MQLSLGAEAARKFVLGGRLGKGAVYMTDSMPDEQKQNRVIAEIVELQREFYFENRSKETERRRRLRDVIERATPLTVR